MLGVSMKILRRVLLHMVLATLGFAANGECKDAIRLRIATESGVVLGEVMDGIRVFKGIPYARPPIGELRWTPPQPPLRWAGERKANLLCWRVPILWARCFQEMAAAGTRHSRGKLGLRLELDLLPEALPV
jgi:Carboxylesterase family